MEQLLYRIKCFIIIVMKRDKAKPDLNGTRHSVLHTRSKKFGRPRAFDEDRALNQAMMAFWEFGFEATSIAILTNAMGMNAPSIYSSFGDKKMLFRKALELYVGSLETIQTQLNSESTALEAIRRMLQASAVRFTGERTPRGCLLASATASCSADASDIQEMAGDKRAAIEKLIRLRIERDIRDGLLSSTSSSKDLAALTIAVIQGMSMLARDGAPRKKLLALSETTLRAWA